jgi:hypothetical protein
MSPPPLPETEQERAAEGAFSRRSAAGGRNCAETAAREVTEFTDANVYRPSRRFRATKTEVIVAPELIQNELICPFVCTAH